MTGRKIANFTITETKLNLCSTPVMSITARWLIFDFSSADTSHTCLRILPGTVLRVRNGLTWFSGSVSQTRDLYTDYTAFSDETAPVGATWFLYLGLYKNSLGIVVSTWYRSLVATRAKGLADEPLLCFGKVSVFPKDATSGTQKAYARDVRFWTGYALSNGSWKNYSNINEDQFMDAFYQYKEARVDLATFGSQNGAQVMRARTPLSDFKKDDIIPESVWCLTFYPAGEKWESSDVYVYDVDTDKAVSAYMMSSPCLDTGYLGSIQGNTFLSSAPTHYNLSALFTTEAKAVALNYPLAAATLAQMGKRLPTWEEFYSLSRGCPIGYPDAGNIIPPPVYSLTCSGICYVSAIGCFNALSVAGQLVAPVYNYNPVNISGTATYAPPLNGLDEYMDGIGGWLQGNNTATNSPGNVSLVAGTALTDREGTYSRGAFSASVQLVTQTSGAYIRAITDVAKNNPVSTYRQFFLSN